MKMNDLPRVPGTRVQCPDDCKFRNKRAPVCGYCLREVLRKLETDKARKEAANGSRKEK